MRKITSKFLRAAGLILLTLITLSPGIALAEIGITTPSGDNTMTRIFGPMFGDVIGGSSGEGIGVLLSQVNMICLLVGSIITGYFLLAGTMQSAHDAKFLGNKWHSVWVPIRVALGASMLVPIKSGFCAAQLLVLFIAGQGSNFATVAYKNYAAQATTNQMQLSIASQPSINEFAQKLFSIHLCMAYDREAQYLMTEKKQQFPYGSSTGNITTKGGEIDYTTPSGVHCGTVSFKPANGLDETGLSQSIAEAHVEAYKEMDRTFETMARNQFSNWSSGDKSSSFEPDKTLATEFIKAREKYVQTLIDKSQALISKYSEDKKADTKNWMQVGTTANTFANAGSTANSAVESTPSASVRSFESYPVTSPLRNIENILPPMSGYSYAVPSSGGAGMPGFSMGGSSSSNASAPSTWQTLKDMGSAVVDGVKSIASGNFDFKKIISDATFKITHSILTGFFGMGQDPFTSSINLGHSIMAGVEAVWLGVLAIAVVLAITLVGLGPVLVTFFSPIGLAFSGLSIALFCFGGFLAVGIPAIPLAYFITATCGWMLLVIEALVCAPIWCIAHLHADGEGISGNALNGYHFLFGLLFRPLLIVIGMTVGFMLARIGCGILDSSFIPWMQSSSGGNVVGLGVLVFLVFIYMSAKISIIMTSYKAVLTLPEAVSRWISPAAAGHHSEIVGAAGAVEQGAQKASGVIQNMGSSVGGAIADKGRDMKREGNEQRKNMNQFQSNVDKAERSMAAGDDANAQKYMDQAQSEMDELKSNRIGRGMLKGSSASGKFEKLSSELQGKQSSNQNSSKE